MSYLKEHSCNNCGKLFWAKNSNQKYCRGCRPVHNLKEKEEIQVTKYIIFLRDDFKCVYCGASSIEDGAKLVLDHIMPYHETKDSSIYNLITCCDSCNMTKRRTILPIEIYERIIERNIKRNKGITLEKQNEINEVLDKYFKKQKKE